MDLHTSARNGDKARMLQLIGLQTDLNTRDKHARTPLHLASWAGQEVRFCWIIQGDLAAALLRTMMPLLATPAPSQDIDVRVEAEMAA